jgi:hypothetical protein
VEDEQGKLYAHATTTCFVFDVPASSASWLQAKAPA